MTYEAVEIGASRWIHARSPERPRESVCGFQAGDSFAFKPTDKPIDCPFCSAVTNPPRAA